MITTACFAIAGFLGLIAGWRRWRTVAQKAPLDSRQLKWCIRAYWTVAATLLTTAAACLASGDYEDNAIERAIAIGFCLAQIPQAALFGFVLVPIGFRSGRFEAWTFAKKLTVAELILVIPALAAVILHLGDFFYLDRLANSLHR
jgi:hypothetical protein